MDFSSFLERNIKGNKTLLCLMILLSLIKFSGVHCSPPRVETIQQKQLCRIKAPQTNIIQPSVD